MVKIILEGCDNSGKTTLANALKNDCLDLDYHHPGGRPIDFVVEARCMQDQAILLSRTPKIVMDRCTAISQQVYVPDPQLDAVRSSWILDALQLGVIFVYCRPDTDWLMSFSNFTWRDGETEEFKQEIVRNQHRFIEAYDKIMLKIPHVHYDYRSDTGPAIIKHLVMAIDGNETSRNLLNAMKTFEAPKCV